MTHVASPSRTISAILSSSLCAGVVLSLGCAASTSTSTANEPAPSAEPPVAAAPACPSEGTWEVVSTDTSFHKLWRDDEGVVWALGTRGETRGLHRLDGETWSTSLDMSDSNGLGRMNPTILFGSGTQMVMAMRSVSGGSSQPVTPPEIPDVAEDRCGHGVWLRDDNGWRPAAITSTPATGPDARVATYLVMYPFSSSGRPGSTPPVKDEAALAPHIDAMRQLVDAHNEEMRLQREEDALYADDDEGHNAGFDPYRWGGRDPMEEMRDLPTVKAVGGGMFEARMGAAVGSDNFESAIFAAQPGDMVGPSLEGNRLVIARVEETGSRKIGPDSCGEVWWHGGWQSPDGVAYIGGSISGGSTYPLGRVARIEGDEIRFMPNSCGITRLGNPERTYGSGQLCALIFDVWGATEDDIFAVGNAGHIIPHDGVEWTPLKASGWETPTQDLNAIWGATGGGVFAVGSAGSIVQGQHKGDLTLVPTPTQARLLEVWGRSASDVFAVGEGGTILHYDGDTWNLEPSGTELELNTVVGLDECDALAASRRGVLLRRRSGPTPPADVSAREASSRGGDGEVTDEDPAD